MSGLPSSETPSPATARHEASPIPTTLQKSREFHRKASDAEWAGDFDLALRFRRIADSFRQRHDQGDLYEPPF